MQPTMSFTLAGGPGVRITVVQTDDGKLQVTAALNAGPVVGDLRGLFFHLGDESLLGGLSVTGSTSPVGAVQQAANGVSNLGGGVNMAGASSAFDMGIAFGTASAAGADDIRSVTFTLQHASQALTLEDFSGVKFGAVVSSVGTGSGPRVMTVKATGTAPVVETDPNTPPEAGNDSVTAAEDGTTVLAGLLSNDTDADSDSLTISGFTQPSLGSVALVAGALVFDAGDDFNGLAEGETQDVTFTYTVSDGKGGSDTATVTVTVTGANDAPVFVADPAVTIRPGQTAVFTGAGLVANDTDADGDALSVTQFFADTDQGGTVQNTAFDTFTYTPPDDFLGSDTFTYVVSDGFGGLVQATLTITVVNSDPVFVADPAVTIRPGQTAVFTGAGLVANDTDADGDALSVTQFFADTDQGGTVENTAFDTFTYTPPDDFLGSDTFTYVVSDGFGGLVTATLTINVVNSDPVFVADPAVTIRPGQTAVFTGAGLVANDTDADGDALSVTQFFVATDQGGTVENTAFDTFTYTPPAGFTGSDTFSYVVSDGFGGLVAATLTINVVNSDPVFVADPAVTIRPGQTAVFTGAGLVANDTDADGDALSVTQFFADTDQGGTVQNTAFDTFTYTPPAGFTGSDTFTYVVSDGFGGLVQATLTINVDAAPNTAPTATNGRQAVDEDGTLNGSVAGLAQDADGDPLTFALVGAPIAGLSFNGDGSYTYAPPADFNGTVNFDFVANDGTADSNTGTVTIEVAAVNDAPVAANETIHIPEDGSTSGNLADLVTDPDGGTLSFIQIGSNPNLTFNSDGTWSYTAVPNYTGPDSFQYQAFDGTASSNIATVTIDINFENDAPTDIALSNASIAENSPAGALVGLFSATDVDSAAFTYAIVSGPSPFAIVGNQLQVNGALDYETQDTYTLTIRVDDGAGGTYDEDFVIAVTDQDETPDNSAPEAGDDSVMAAEDGTTVLSGLLSNDTDADSDSLTIAAVTQPAKGSVSVVGGQVVFDAASDFEGLDDGESEDVTFGYTVSDGKGGTDTATVTVTVNGANDAPVVTNDAQAVDEDGTLNGSVAGLAQDADGEGLTFALVGAPIAGLTFNGDGSYTYAPPADFNGTVSFDFVANDGTADSNTGTVTIEVNAVNDAPTVIDGQEIVVEDGTLNGALAGLAFDVDGDTLTFILADAPDFGDFTWNTDGTYTYAPSENFTLGDSFQFYVNDGTADSNIATLTIVITPVNDAPVVADDTIVIAEAGFILADLNDLLTDPDGGTPSFSLVGPNPAGVIVNPNGTWQYAPGPDFNGTISFQYQANDGTDDSNVATITIEVTPVNDAPTDIALSNASVQENSPNGTVVGLLSATDIDSSSFTYSILGGPTPFAIVGNQLQVNGALDYETQDSYTLTIQVNDGAGGTRTEAFVITVTDVDETPDNQAPTVEDGVASVNEDGTLNGSVTSLANDPDGDNLVFALVGTTPAGLTFNGDGSYVYAPPANFNGSITFDFIANDGNADSNQGTVTITVNAVNDAPTAPSGPVVAVNEDTYVFVTREQLIAGATDAEGDALFVTGLTTNAFVTGYLQNDGIWVSGTLNTNGTRTATYQLSDGNGGLVDGILTLNIAPVNDAPTVTATTFAGTEDQPFVIAITDLLAQVAADVDGDTITFLNVSGPFGGTVTTNAGNLIFTPQANRDSAGSFFLSVTDGTETAGGTITVTLAPVNDAPVAGDDVVARSGNPQVISFATLFANDSDVDTAAANRTISAIGSESGVTVAVDNVARTVTVTYDAGHVGGYSFEYTVSDGAGGFDTALVTLNNPPVANNDATTIGENDSWTNYHFVNVTGNDSDADGDLLTVTGVVALGGAPVIAEGWDSNADGRNDSLRFYINDPSNNTNGTFQVEYTVSDQRGGTDTAIVTINVTPEDDAPIVRPDLAGSEIVTTSQFTPVDIAFATLLANDEHPDGTDFTITSVQSFSRGSAVLVDTNGDTVNDAVRFTPDANVGGVQDYASSWLAYFYYTVTETNGDGDTASTYAYVRVTDVNEGPSAEDDTVARSGDPQVIAFDTLFANDYDWDSPTSGWTITGISAESGVTVTVDSVARTVTVDYDAGHTGAYSFDYTLSDGEGGTATATVSLNTVPVADDDTVTVGENDAYFAVQYVDVLANDEDADGDALSIVNAQALGGVPVVAYWSAENFLTFYLTDAYFNDAFEIQYTVSDGRGATDTAILSVTVTPQNDAPVGVSEQVGTFSTAEDTAIVIPVASLLANGDFDGDSEDFWISSVTYYGAFGGTAVLDDKGTADHADDEVVFTPNANFNGNAYFYYSLTDAAGATDLDTYAYVTVTPVNDPVTANDDVIARLFPEAGTQTITRAQLVGNDVDVDSDAAITGVVAGANVSSIVLNADQSVTVTYTSGSATFTYTLSDGTFSDTAEVTLNSGPQQTGTPGVLNLTEDTQSYFSDDQLIALAGVTDANNDNLYISGYGTNDNVSVWGGWWWNYEENWLTPAPENFNGATTFTFTISDGNAATDLTVTLDVQVAAVDDRAVAEDDSDPAWVTNEQTSIVIQIADLLANDYDIEGDAFSAINFYTNYAVGYGAVVNNGNGTVTYTPGTDVAEGYNGAYGGDYWYGYDGPGFFYQVTGGDAAFVRVIVNNVNDPVVATDDYVARLPGAPEEQDVTYAQMVNNDSNPDPNGTLTIISVQNAVNGTAVLNDNGTAGDASDDFVTFTHTGGGAGFYEYTVQDEGGSTSTATVYFNGAPVAQPDAITVSETEATYSPDGSSRNIALTRLELVGNDSDPEEQTLSVTAPGIYPAWDESVISHVSYYGSGVTIYLLDPDWEGETWFEYRAYDSGSPTAYSEPVRVTLTVEDGNDTPLASWDYWYYNGAGFSDTNPATNLLVGYEDSYMDIPVSLLINGQYLNGSYYSGADFDEEGDALSIAPGSLSSSDGFAQLVDIDGEQFVRFTPNGEENGDLWFYYAVTDGNTTSDTVGVNVYVIPVNDAPVVDDAFIPVPIGDSEFFISFSQLLAYVSDEDHSDFDLSFTGAFEISGGSISIEDNGIRFIADGSGDPMQFEYSFADPEGASDSGIITLDPTEAPPVVLYFRGYDYQGGNYQLWHYVPSESPFVEIALPEINGYYSYYPYNITPYGDGVVFSAYSGNDGLYAYSEVGGLETLVYGDPIYEVLVVGEDLYATSYSGFYVFGPGSPEGYLDPAAYGISELTEGNGTAFFAGYTSEFGELAIFRYDAGSQSVEQFVISTDGSIDNISDIAVTEDAVFFVADSFGDGTSSYGTLFRLDLDDETVDGDGFAIGTVSSFGWTGMVEGEPSARDLVVVGEQVYFIAYNANYNEQLWRADDSGAGVLIYDNSSGHDGYFNSLDYDGQYSLIEFQDGVLAYFYDYDLGYEALYFGNESGFTIVDEYNYNFQDLEVVGDEAFYIAEDGDGNGYEVFVFDGSSVQRLTDHAPYYMNELEVLSRDRLFVTSSDYYGGEGGSSDAVFEYSPADYGDTATHRLDRENSEIAYYNLTSSEYGLYFNHAVGDTWYTYFVSYNTGELQSLDGFSLSSNGERGFFGQVPLASFTYGQGAEAAFYEGTVVVDGLDIAPGQDPDFPANPANSFPSGFAQLEQLGDSSIADIYTVANIPALGEDTAYLFRISHDAVTDTRSFEQVQGLSAVGSPTDPNTLPEYILAPIALGDALLVNKYIPDYANNVYTYELWAVRGTTATLVDDQTGYVFRTEAAQVGDFLFFEDEFTGGFGSEVKIYDLATGTTTLVDLNPGAERGDPREFVVADGGVYLRAQLDSAGFSGNNELVRIETDGSFTVIDLEDNAGTQIGSFARQIATDGSTVYAFGDSEGGPALWLVSGTTVEMQIDLFSAGISGIPFLDAGTEFYDGGLFFFADSWSNGTQLFRFDLASQEVSQITSGTTSARYDAFDYSMEVAEGVLWFVYDEGYGNGLEVYTYDGVGYGSWTDLDLGGYGYGAYDLAAIAPQDDVILVS